jgi:hypothetical protein
MKKILFFLLIINQLSFAQTTDLGRLNWTFRGPSNDILESKSIVDIETDPNDATENTVWALSLGGELFVNRAISNANSQWSKINVPEQLIKIYFEPNPTKKLYAISDHNLYLTQDEGKTWQNLLYSADKLTGLVIAKTGRIFLQTPKGITVNLNPNQWIAVEASASTQMWVNFNNRLFWKDTNSQYFYSDNPYLTKIPVSLSEIQAQGFASVGLEHFGAFIVPNGLYHGYRSSSQRIITDKNTFSIDGGVSFIQATFPENMNEVVFSGNNLIFATKKGVFLQKPANQPTETRNLGLEGEYRMAAIRPQSGDDLVSVISDKYAFTLRNQENSIAFIANTTDVGEWVWASWVKDKNGAASIFRTISNGNEETRKHTEIDNNFTFLLHESDRLYRFKNNTRTLLIDYPSVLVIILMNH